jgi:hypothetical protein
VARVVRQYREGNQHAVLGLLRDVVDEGNLAEVLSLLSAPLADRLRDSFARHPTLKGVGYWKPLPGLGADRDADFPDVTLLVRPKWRLRDRKRIVAYLRAGSVHTRWRGLSYCRFRCGIDHSEMGSRCLTDGEWVWPEGLAHYVEKHDVCLPDEFVASMRENGWAIPERAKEVTREECGRPRTDFWIAWARANLGGT